MIRYLLKERSLQFDLLENLLETARADCPWSGFAEDQHVGLPTLYIFSLCKGLLWALRLPSMAISVQTPVVPPNKEDADLI